MFLKINFKKIQKIYANYLRKSLCFFFMKS